MQKRKPPARGALLFWALTLLPFALAAAALPFLPDPLPAHVGANGVVDRWGSRGEVFILPGAGLCVMLLIRWILRRAVRDPKEARLVMGVLCGVGMLFLSITVGVTLSWLTFDKTIPAYRFLSPVAIGLGACCLISGFGMARRQRWGGKALFATGGMLLVVAAFAYRSILPIVSILLIPMVLAIACSVHAAHRNKAMRK
ncbi:MAG: DUF1648 domain-containing protein [Oscillospiraceae bacterium]|jgi:hypothetical protein|nr:DUF1648 domain-containing protein [Oscillospiraceae bacterium]